MEELKPNEQRAKNATILIWIVLIMEIVAFVSHFFQYILLQSAANGEAISMEYATSNDLRERIIAIISLIVYLVSAFTFIQWFRRAYFNLHLRVNLLSHNEGWAAGCWFVPILNLYRPNQIMKEMFEETKQFLKKNEISINEGFTSIGLWWTLWIVNGFLGQFIFKYSMKAETIDEFTISTIADMISNIIGIPLAIITIQMIKEYSNYETLLTKVEIIE